MSRFVILPSRDPTNLRLLRAPFDYAGQELFRHITGLIADIENSGNECKWEDIADRLETNGYEVLEFSLGPSLDFDCS